MSPILFMVHVSLDLQMFCKFKPLSVLTNDGVKIRFMIPVILM